MVAKKQSIKTERKNEKIKEDSETQESTFRKISKDKYVVAGIITLLIFSLGITLGFIIEDYRYNLIEEVNMNQDINYLSLQMQYLFLTSFSNLDNCPMISATLKAAVTDLEESLSKVIAYEEEQEVSEIRRELVMRRYALDNLRYWLLAVESKQKCNLDIVPIIYFYSTKCPSCPNQGTVLTFFKNKFGERVLVFPINTELKQQEPMIEIIMSQFDIEKLPTTIVNNKKYEGVVGQDQLQEIICSHLNNAAECQ
jgi:hypothetical protein